MSKSRISKAKLQVPTDNTTRTWIKAVRNVSATALEVLKGLAQSDDKALELSPITLTLFTRDAFKELTAKEQGISLEILAMWKVFQLGKHYKVEVHLIEVFSQAKRAAGWMEALCSVVPVEDWSDTLTREVEAYAFRKPSLRATISAYMDTLEAQIKELIDSLPQEIGKPKPELETWIVQAYRAQPPAKIKRVLEDDTQLRAFLRDHETMMQNARNAITTAKLRSKVAAPSPTQQWQQDDDDGGGDEDEDEDEGDGSGGGDEYGDGGYEDGGGGSGPGDLGGRGWRGKEPVNDEPVAGENNSGNEGSGKRKGSELPPKGAKGKGKKRRSSRAAPLRPADLPAENEVTADNKARIMAETCIIHERLYYCSRVSVDSLSTHVKTHNKATLALLNSGAEKGLLGTSNSVTSRINLLCDALVNSGSIHDEATVICAVPSPSHDNLHRWVEALRKPGCALDVEDHPMTVIYQSRGGGRPGQRSNRRHYAGRQQFYIVAHQAGTFVCNTAVTTENPTGAGSSTPVCVNYMTDVAFEHAQSAFPRRFLTHCVCRFTNPGDTVMSTCGDVDLVF